MAEQSREPPDPGSSGGSGGVSSVAGLIAVLAGLLTVTVVAGLAVGFLAQQPGQGPSIAAIATTAIGVVGSIVAAYFGVRVAAQGRDRAEDARASTEAAGRSDRLKVEELTAQLDPEQARVALGRAEERAADINPEC